MASLAHDADGTKRILVGRGRNRRAIRLGRVTVKAAEGFLNWVERLESARMTGTPIDAHTAAWLASLPDEAYAKVARAGLVEERPAKEAWTLGEMLDAFMAAADVKPATRVRMTQACDALRAYFGNDADPDAISEGQAEAWRASIRKRYAQATTSRTVLYARQAFRWAERRSIVSANPFTEVKAGNQTNNARAAFVDRPTIAQVLNACPDAEWRALVMLSRYGGLRVPSEALALRWSDIDWQAGRMTVRATKTEHHEGGGVRVVPLFPEVRDALLDLWETAEPGDDRVIVRYAEGSNLNPQLRRIISKAGLTPWPRTWHNMRASRQTELASQYPLATVCGWIGNSKAIAAGHYLQTTDADWQRAIGEPGAKSGATAAQNPAHRATSRNAAEHRSFTEMLGGRWFALLGGTQRHATKNRLMGRAGLEPATPAFSMRCSTN
jgi:integrase